MIIKFSHSAKVSLSVSYPTVVVFKINTKCFFSSSN